MATSPGKSRVKQDESPPTDPTDLLSLESLLSLSLRLSPLLDLSRLSRDLSRDLDRYLNQPDQ